MHSSALSPASKKSVANLPSWRLAMRLLFYRISCLHSIKQNWIPQSPCRCFWQISSCSEGWDISILNHATYLKDTVSARWYVRPSVPGFIDRLIHRSVSPMVRWFVKSCGPSVLWSVSSLVIWSVAPSVCHAYIFLPNFEYNDVYYYYAKS